MGSVDCAVKRGLVDSPAVVEVKGITTRVGLPGPTSVGQADDTAAERGAVGDGSTVEKDGPAEMTDVTNGRDALVAAVTRKGGENELEVKAAEGTKEAEGRREADDSKEAEKDENEMEEDEEEDDEEAEREEEDEEEEEQKDEAKEATRSPELEEIAGHVDGESSPAAVALADSVAPAGPVHAGAAAGGGTGEAPGAGAGASGSGAGEKPPPAAKASPFLPPPASAARLGAPLSASTEAIDAQLARPCALTQAELLSSLCQKWNAQHVLPPADPPSKPSAQGTCRRRRCRHRPWGARKLPRVAPPDVGSSSSAVGRAHKLAGASAAAAAKVGGAANAAGGGVSVTSAGSCADPTGAAGLGKKGQAAKEEDEVMRLVGGEEGGADGGEPGGTVAEGGDGGVVELGNGTGKTEEGKGVGKGEGEREGEGEGGGDGRGGEGKQWDVRRRERRRKKLLQFVENTRPAYYGTYSLASGVVRARAPLRKDPVLNYDVDSEAEWEEEDPAGESLSDSEGEDDLDKIDPEEGGDGEDEEEEDGFVVPDGAGGATGAGGPEKGEKGEKGERVERGERGGEEGRPADWQVQVLQKAYAVLPKWGGKRKREAGPGAIRSSSTMPVVDTGALEPTKDTGTADGVGNVRNAASAGNGGNGGRADKTGETGDAGDTGGTGTAGSIGGEGNIAQDLNKGKGEMDGGCVGNKTQHGMEEHGKTADGKEIDKESDKTEGVQERSKMVHMKESSSREEGADRSSSEGVKVESAATGEHQVLHRRKRRAVGWGTSTQILLPVPPRRPSAPHPTCPHSGVCAGNGFKRPVAAAGGGACASAGIAGHAQTTPGASAVPGALGKGESTTPLKPPAASGERCCCFLFSPPSPANHTPLTPSTHTHPFLVLLSSTPMFLPRSLSPERSPS
ncbi:unnamed protein product [Closterium sp. Naga37s-1]|nr:unnamed protein product [Closterium sp. Naga37s-1]